MTTDQQPTLHQELEAPPFQVAPTRNSKLEHLHAVYADAKAKADGAAEDLKAITDAIKVELTTASPGQERIELVGTAGPPLRLIYVESARFDSKRFQQDDPENWVRYAKFTGSWTLKQVGGKA